MATNGTFLIVVIIILSFRGFNSAHNTSSNCSVELPSNPLKGTESKLISEFDPLTKSMNVLQLSYTNKSDDVFMHSAASLTRQSDIFSQMLKVFETTECTAEIAARLRPVKEDFTLFSDRVLINGHYVHDILSKYRLSEIQKQISESAKRIASCSNTLRLFFQNPTSWSTKLNIVNCYDNMNVMKKIGNTLINYADKPSTNSLFGEIIEQTGYCNGSEILHVYRYLLGVFVEGCVTIVVSEAAKYNSVKTDIKDFCITTLDEAARIKINLFEKCRNEACTNIDSNLQKVSRNADMGVLGDQLKELYPWFYFLVLRFAKQSKPSENVIGSNLNSLKISENTDYGLQLILWSSHNPIAYNQDTKLYKFGIEFESNALESKFSNINVHYDTKLTSSNLTRLIGEVEYPVRYRCRTVIKETSDDASCSGAQCLISVHRYTIIILSVVMSLALVALFICTLVLVIFIRKRHKNLKHNVQDLE